MGMFYIFYIWGALKVMKMFFDINVFATELETAV